MTDRIQVGTLKAMGAILRLATLFSKSGRDRDTPPRGFGRLSRWIGNTVFQPTNQHTIELRSGKPAKISFYLNDTYWSRLVLPWIKYEPEIASVLDRVLTPKTVFLDCGANIGYWSVYASTYIPPHNIVAVEPFPPSFGQLLHNAALNGNFTCVDLAITDRDDARVQLSGSGHAAMSVGENDATALGGECWCTTITIDTLLFKYVRPEADRIVIKLDIEGAEIAALKGATALLERKPLIIYEDHGRDRTSAISRYLSQQLGYKLFYWEASNKLQEVTLSDLSTIKRDKRVGYNFFAWAADTEFWN